jgi:hypothetical protein
MMMNMVICVLHLYVTTIICTKKPSNFASDNICTSNNVVGTRNERLLLQSSDTNMKDLSILMAMHSSLLKHSILINS